MWAVAVILSSAFLLSCVATSSEQSGLRQKSQWNLDPRRCSDERTSLMQTASILQKRGAVASPDTAAGAFAAPGEVQRARGGAEEQEPVLREVAHDATSSLAATQDARGILDVIDDVQPRGRWTEVGMSSFSSHDVDGHKPLYTRSPPPSLAIVRFGQALTCGAGVILVIFAVSCMCCPQRSPMPTPSIMKMRKSWAVWLLSLSYVTVQMTMTDQYLPSLAKMQVDFDTTPLMMSATLQVNWLLKGLSALSMAGLSSYFGRKPMLVLCCILTCMGCAACACAQDVQWFMAARVLQGIAEGGEPIFAMIARDMIPDPNERMSYTAGYFSVLFLVPIMAPAFGGWLGHFFHWRLPFLLLSVWSFINTVLILPVFGETRPLDLIERTKHEYKAEVQRICSNGHIALLAVVQAVGVMMIYSVDSNFSLLLSNIYHQNQFDVSLKLVSLAAVCLSSSILLEVVAKPFGPLRVLQGAMGCAVVPIASSFLVGFFATQTWQPLFATICACLLVVVVSCMSADALYHLHVPDITDAAVGINTCISMVFASGMTFLCSCLAEGSGNHARWLAFWLGGSMLALCALFWLLFGFRPPAWAHEDLLEEESFEATTEKTSRGTPRGEKDGDCFKGMSQQPEAAAPPREVTKE